MDWNLKAPSWDLSEVDDEANNLPNIEAASSRFGVYRVKGEFSVDLKLGQVGNSGTEQFAAAAAKNKDDAAAVVVVGGGSKMAAASSSPSGSSKRARAVNNGSQRVSCLVDGCNSDLSACRDYHRRHKVCEQHSKTAQVTIGGLKQRFCQQCSRFHSLEEFDEGKRSCRKRLDGHNRRRRKAQPDPLTRSGGFLSNYHQGTQLLPFSGSQLYPSSGVVNHHPGWSTGGGGGVVTSQQVHMVDHHHKQDLFLGSSPTTISYNKQQGKQQQLAYLQTDPSVCQTLLRNNMFCDNNNNSLTSSVHDSSCALSLLSSPPPPPPPQQHHHHSSSSSSFMMQPLGLSLHDSSSSSSSMVDPAVLAGPTNGTDHHCSSMYSMEDDSHGSQGNIEAHQLFPFQWE